MGEKTTRVQPYTKSCKKLSSTENTRSALPQERAHHMASPENKHPSNIIKNEKVIFMFRS